jgi:hypothetical protein
MIQQGWHNNVLSLNNPLSFLEEHAVGYTGTKAGRGGA